MHAQNQNLTILGIELLFQIVPDFAHSGHHLHFFYLFFHGEYKFSQSNLNSYKTPSNLTLTSQLLAPFLEFLEPYL